MTVAFVNRIKKNERHLRKWAKKNSFDAVRMYDRDIPEFPHVVDRFGDFWVVYDRSDKEGFVDECADALREGLALTADKVVVKKRARQKGSAQYEKVATSRDYFSVREGELRFLVNVTDYLDCGLFLDHRPLRQDLANASLSEKRVLNLFCYTGSLSVAAAKAGAIVTSVDLSNTYLEWAKKNFEHNDIRDERHRFFRGETKEFLSEHAPESRYDLIIVDPPTFSNSKSMDYTFDVKTQHVELIDRCMALLARGGETVFSTNFRSFRLDEGLLQKYVVEDVSAWSIPQDFRDQKIHKCYRIKARSS